MLSDKFKDSIEDHLIPFDSYKPWPACNDREAWRAIDEDFKDIYLNAAENEIKNKFKTVSAGLLLKTGKTDVVTEYNQIRSANNKILFTLTIAECIENKGRFMRHLLDGVSNMLDEATWHLPCPTAMYKRFPAVMVDVTDPLIELSSSSMVYNLAVIYYLLKHKFDALDINIGKRIYQEVDRKIFAPFLNRTDYWWMAYERHYHNKMGVLYSINNFTTHCTNYVLEAFLLLEKDSRRRAAAIEKTMQVLDNYLNYIADDGWCDEGNGYWFMSYGALNKVLEKIKTATGGYVDIFNDEKIYNMGQYMCNAHIGNGYFVNFADSHPINKLLSSKVIEYAVNTGNDDLMKLALEETDSDEFKNFIKDRPVGFETSLFLLFSYDKIKNEYISSIKQELHLASEYYYSDSQVLVAREKTNSYSGFYLACKGGHNDENHNHNDAGNFIVYRDAKPILVDSGVEAYIPDTFNKNRYKLWTMQSKYHNLPTFNGVMQKETRRYKAKNVKYASSDNVLIMSMSLKDAYEQDSRIVKFERTVSYDRNSNQIVCSEDIEMLTETKDIEFSFMTPCRTKTEGDSVIFYSEGIPVANMLYDTDLMEISEELITFRDEKLSGEWNNYLKRLIFKLTRPIKEANLKFVIR